MQLDDAPWTSDESSASGQVFEFLLWAAITSQSRGWLHVYLPLTDRGIDGLVHRIQDGVYLPIQAKCRSSLDENGEVHLVIWADSLQDDNALIVAGLITDDGLGPTMLVVAEGDFKRLANLSTHQGKAIYSMQFGVRPRSDSRWLPWLVPTERLAERLGVAPPAAEQAPIQPPPSWRSDLGFLGEAEVIRNLAESPLLNLYRAFPDSETAEIPVLHLATRRVIGLQVKTVGVTRARMRATVDVYRQSFRPAPTTYFVVFAWLRDEARFHDECLLIPSVYVPTIGRDDGEGHISFEFRPGNEDQQELDAYRQQLTALRHKLEELLL